MKLEILAAVAIVVLAGCGGAPTPESERAATPPKREGAFDPLVGTIDRAKSVQQTVDEQAAEQRRQIEAAER